MNQATYHITQVINGEKTQRDLCEACMGKSQSSAVFTDASSLLASFLGGMPVRQIPLRCSGCGMTYDRFSQTGMLGCAQCYQDFRKQLTPMLQRIHGNMQHEGHVPKVASQKLQMTRKLEQLRQEMQQAIDQEDFEKAAALRDQVRALQNRRDEGQENDKGKEGAQHA